MEALKTRLWTRRFGAATLAVAFTCSTALPARAATPSPRSDEWWFRTWSVQDKVWPLTRGAGVTVALIDTGVNAKLPELAGAVLSGTGTDSEATDGRVDTDEPGHGTAMAAQIVGQGGGTTGYVGLAPEAKILPIQAGTSGAIADGIKIAVDRGAKIVNISLGDTSDMYKPVHCAPEYAHAIGYALQHDVIIVASAGNSGDEANLPEAPASCPGVLAVGALTKQLRPWKKTQRQNYVTIAAPGAGQGLVVKNGTYYRGNSGTSSAAALTSAAIALIRSKNPAMPARTVVQRIFATARSIGASGWNNRTGFGLIDIAAAMDPASHPVPATASNPLYDAFSRWQGSISPTPSTAPAIPNAAASPRQPKSNSHSFPSPTLLALGGAGLLIFGAGAAVTLMLVRRRSTKYQSPIP
ncbi:S8 family serine peptidase [Spirillospora sp. NPDC052269]